MDKVKIIFVTEDDQEKEIDAPLGLSILEVAHQNDIDLEGACEGSMACSTCHVILDEDYYNRLPVPSEPEEDMLDLAFCLTSTSRLGCQIILDEEFKILSQEIGRAIKIYLPSATRNIKL